MKFNDYLNNAWNDHTDNSLSVAANFSEGIRLIESNDQIPQLVHLITHVMGEHLGKLDDGISLLNGLKKLPHFITNSESEEAINRSVGVLEFAGGKNKSLKNFSLSDQVRILSVAASALSEQKKTEAAQEAFKEALSLAQMGLTKSDPANRSLAITGNNLACSLEEKESRNEVEVELMILAAQTARKYWEVAGDWMNVERSEYRLANSYLKANNLAKALEHAQTCLEIINENKGDSLELFFGWEAVALIENARGNRIGFEKARALVQSNFDQLDEGNKSWCKTTLEKINLLC